MSQTKPERDGGNSNANADNSAGDHSVGADSWILEEIFPDPSELLSPSKRLSASDAEVLVVLDTNVLLLPYAVSNEDLSAIENT